MSTRDTIDTVTAKQLVEAAAIQTASIIGQPGGWSVVVKIGSTEKVLVAQRSDTPRVWRSLDRCIDYLKNELRLTRFDKLDATHHSHAPVAGSVRGDAADRMRHAHQAAAYDKWLTAEIQEAIDDTSPTIPHDEVMRDAQAAIRRVSAKRAPP